MSEKLTWKEIESRYPDEWVLIDNPKTDKQLRVLSGTLVAHSKHRSAITRATKKCKAKRIAVLHTAGPDKDKVFVL